MDNIKTLLDHHINIYNDCIKIKACYINPDCGNGNDCVVEPE